MNYPKSSDTDHSTSILPSSVSIIWANETCQICFTYHRTSHLIIVTIVLCFGDNTSENLYTLNYAMNLSLTINIVTYYY